MRQPQSRLNRGQKSRTVSLSAPLGGWNARDAWADMPNSDAVSMINWFPGTTDLMLRKGYSQWSTGYGAQVESLLIYSGGASMQMFGVTSTGSIYDASAGGAVGAAVVSGLSNGRLEHVNVATSGGNFMLSVNGQNKLIGYNGTTWWADGDGTHDITVLDTSTVNNITVFKNRVWMIQANTLNAWYLPTSSIAGAAVQFPLQSVAHDGGYLVGVGAWTIDGGYGLDDQLAFITNTGEVIVYKGTDPSSITTWSLIGVWSLGSPVGRRCMMKYGGDLLIITQDGIVPMASSLQSSRLDPRVSITNKIQWAVSQAISTYGSNFGWQMCYFPKENQLYLNVPINTGSGQEQYVMNTITQSWCRFTGWGANCFDLFNDLLHFGGNGFIGKAWDTFADNSTNIQGDCAQAFSYFKSTGQQKHFTMARPMLLTNGSPAVLATLNVDFQLNSNFSPLSVTPITYGVWDTSTWDIGVWGDIFSFSNEWQGVNGIGYAGGIELEVASQGIETHWVATDLVFEEGGTL